MILAADDNWPVVVKNLAQARKVCSRMSRIVIREGAAPQASGFFFKDVVQEVLFFREETWLVPPAWSRPWGGFRPRWRDG